MSKIQTYEFQFYKFSIRSIKISTEKYMQIRFYSSKFLTDGLKLALNKSYLE